MQGDAHENVFEQASEALRQARDYWESFASEKVQGDRQEFLNLCKELIIERSDLLEVNELMRRAILDKQQPK